MRGFRGLQDSDGVRREFANANVSVPLRGFRGLQAIADSIAKASSIEGFSPLAGF